MITPRALRDGLLEGTWTQDGQLPEPPPEWAGWRRARLSVAIHAAKLFLIHRYTYDEVQRYLGERGLMRPVQQQRVGQYIARGTQFFLDRGAFVQLYVQAAPAKRPAKGVKTAKNAKIGKKQTNPVQRLDAKKAKKHKS